MVDVVTILKEGLTGFLLLVGCYALAWVLAVGYHHGRRDAARWFGPIRHILDVPPEKKGVSNGK